LASLAGEVAGELVGAEHRPLDQALEPCALLGAQAGEDKGQGGRADPAGHLRGGGGEIAQRRGTELAARAGAERQDVLGRDPAAGPKRQGLRALTVEALGLGGGGQVTAEGTVDLLPQRVLAGLPVDDEDQEVDRSGRRRLNKM
jgi:hypothetical protein